MIIICNKLLENARCEEEGKQSRGLTTNGTPGGKRKRGGTPPPLPRKRLLQLKCVKSTTRQWKTLWNDKAQATFSLKQLKFKRALNYTGIKRAMVREGGGRDDDGMPDKGGSQVPQRIFPQFEEASLNYSAETKTETEQKQRQKQLKLALKQKQEQEQKLNSKWRWKWKSFLGSLLVTLSVCHIRSGAVCLQINFVVTCSTTHTHTRTQSVTKVCAHLAELSSSWVKANRSSAKKSSKELDIFAWFR